MELPACKQPLMDHGDYSRLSQTLLVECIALQTKGAIGSEHTLALVSTSRAGYRAIGLWQVEAVIQKNAPHQLAGRLKCGSSTLPKHRIAAETLQRHYTHAGEQLCRRDEFCNLAWHVHYSNKSVALPLTQLQRRAAASTISCKLQLIHVIRTCNCWNGCQY
jgi:hypothetical protein